jgi:hypothetical protein
VAKLRTERHVELVVIGRLKEGGPSARTIDELGLREASVTTRDEDIIVEVPGENKAAFPLLVLKEGEEYISAFNQLHAKKSCS